MTEEDLIRVLTVMASRSGAPDHELISALLVRGFTRTSARKILTLVPLAFGRVLLVHMGVSEPSRSFLLRTDDGVVHERELSAEPIFCCALQVAVRMAHAGPSHLFRAAAEHSCEVGAASQALYAGEELTGAKLGPPEISAGSVAEWESA
ncbi:MAG: hypothetical protein HOW73_22505 [Polyangiaceae bacterium]|nr:hypothetical protein [Polyangiaceae bacterium]